MHEELLENGYILSAMLLIEYMVQKFYIHKYIKADCKDVYIKTFVVENLQEYEYANITAEQFRTYLNNF